MRILLKIAVIAGIVDTQPQILWNETVKVSEEYGILPWSIRNVENCIGWKPLYFPNVL